MKVDSWTEDPGRGSGSKSLRCLSGDDDDDNNDNDNNNNNNNNNNNTIKKKTSNIGIKVPDIEWQTTGQNVRLLASNENPGYKRSSFCRGMGWGK